MLCWEGSSGSREYFRIEDQSSPGNWIAKRGIFAWGHYCHSGQSPIIAPERSRLRCSRWFRVPLGCCVRMLLPEALIFSRHGAPSSRRPLANDGRVLARGSYAFCSWVRHVSSRLATTAFDPLPLPARTRHPAGVRPGAHPRGCGGGRRTGISTTAPHKVSRYQEPGSRHRKCGPSPPDWRPNGQTAL